MNNFRLIQEHFSQLRCAYCDSAFTPDGVELLREEEDYWVVRVSCSCCQQPAGVAIVGIEYEETMAKSEVAAVTPSNEMTARDKKRLSKLPPINSDDVLDAHRFFQGLGSDWRRHLPRRFS